MNADVTVNVAVWAVAGIDVERVKKVFGDSKLEEVALELHRLRSRTTALEIDNQILYGDPDPCPECACIRCETARRLQKELQL